MRTGLAVAVALAAGAVAAAVVAGAIPRRRLPWLRLVFGGLAGAAVGLGRTAGGVALLGLGAAIAVSVWSIYRRHGASAWLPGEEDADPAPAPRPVDPQLHRNGLRRPRSRRDPLAVELDAMRPELLDVLAPHGVVRVDVIGGAAPSGGVTIWLGTSTDAELATIGAGGPLLADVRRVVVARGLDPAAAARVRTAGLSAETVDRDHGGNWFAAMR